MGLIKRPALHSVFVSMRSLLVLSLSSFVTGAALDTRDPVPSGYVAPPYYPSNSKISNLYLSRF